MCSILWHFSPLHTPLYLLYGNKILWQARSLWEFNTENFKNYIYIKNYITIILYILKIHSLSLYIYIVYLPCKYLYCHLTPNRQQLISTQAANICLISMPYSAVAMVFRCLANKNINVWNIWMFNGTKETVVPNCSLSECYSICQKYFDRSPWNIISIIYASALKSWAVNIRQLHSVSLLPWGDQSPILWLKN